MRCELTKSKFNSKTFDFNTILNYQLSQKLKPIEKYKFNHLIISLTHTLKKKKKNQNWSLWTHKVTNNYPDKVNMS